MEYPILKSIIEGLLFVAGDEGLEAVHIAEVVEQETRMVKDIIKELQSDYVTQGRGMQILETAGAYRFASLADHAIYFERLAASPTRSGLSQAALETLAIIVYKQPLTRIDIEEIRGVKTDKRCNPSSLSN